MIRRWRRSLRDDRGSAAIELVVVAFFLTVVASLCAEGIYVSQVGAATEKAARDGARAMSLGRDVSAEVDRQLPDWAQVESLRTGTDADASCAGHCLRVEVRIPLIVPGFTSGSFTVARDAELPRG